MTLTQPAPQFLRLHTPRAQGLALTIESVMSARPDGFTLGTTLNGGTILLGVAGDYMQPTGYAVGGIIPGLRVSTRNPRSYPVLDKFATWAEKYFVIRDALPLDDIYVGGWKDDANFWLDATLILPDVSVARRFGKLKGEKAIGRIENGHYMETLEL